MHRRLRTLLGLAAGALSVIAACNFTLDGYQGDGGPPDGGLDVAASDGTATDGAEPGSDATADDAASTDAGGDASTHACPSAHGPTMVRVGNGGSASFCIDSTEVTIGDYATFLGTHPVPSNMNQPPPCSFNTTFAPADGSNVDDPSKTKYPITLIDWCDAYAFCQYAGKRLCGKVGGGASSPDGFGTTTNEVFYACSKGGSQSYNYGATFFASTCNATDTGSVEPVGNRPACVGAYAGVYDLMGNVGEWQDDCEAQDGGNDYCPDNSTSFEFSNGDLPTAQRCDHADHQFRSDQYNDLGFRCCAD